MRRPAARADLGRRTHPALAAARASTLADGWIPFGLSASELRKCLPPLTFRPDFDVASGLRATRPAWRARRHAPHADSLRDLGATATTCAVAAESPAQYCEQLAALRDARRRLGTGHSPASTTDDTTRRSSRRGCVTLEDERAIERMIASYGPLVDAGEADATADLWAVDGTYDVEGWSMRSRDDVAAMVRSDAHQGLIERGCCHFLGPAVVTVDGDDAVAVCESALFVKATKGFRVYRAGANHFRLQRRDGGWQIIHRTSRPLDGSRQARDLLSAGVAGRAPAAPAHDD